MNSLLKGIQKVVPVHWRAKFQYYRYRFNGYQAIGDPMRVYSVNPSNIQKGIPSTNFNFRIPSFAIKNGSWDKNVVNIEASGTTHSMFVKHFKHGIPWKDTEKYGKVAKEITETGGAGTIGKQNSSIDEWDEYLNYLDRLYYKIKKEGYKSQDEIAPENNDLTNRNIHPAFNEIQVFVGRNGELIIKSGVHRLAIAKILELDEIPVRTQVRHKQWQKVRDKIKDSDKQDGLSDEIKIKWGHPEIQDIVS